jgi:hypothetical protein
MVVDAAADRVLTLRIGDGIVLISTGRRSAAEGCSGATVELTADEVELHPYEL